MTARIYQPTKNAMQSGKAKTDWMLEYLPEKKTQVDRLIGWTGSSDMKQEIKLKFDTKEEAVSYAHKNNIEFELIEPKVRAIKIQSYSDNFTN